jgi:NADH dehydrogenase [ubiquinone] 1 alpha subcomplex assembly factor 7|tara:strand:+ start:241 stop:1338 length:1098 start_codon:yes stop_codon:yes gene_type:complete
LTALKDHIVRRIGAEGPLGVDQYMAEALAHPELGYYMTGDPLGRAGDFVTAPEVSQMFGELIGLWCAHVWTQMDRPPLVHLVELGPGRGTLMADALRAAAGVEGFLSAAEAHLVEISPALQKRQRRSLKVLAVPVSWHQRFAEVPDAPLLVIANEFLDALPIRQFVRLGEDGADGWAERCVGLDDAGEGLAWVDRDGASPTDLPPALADAPEGALIEVSPQRSKIAAELAAAIAARGGGALLIDYGHMISAPGDTLQAVKGHRYHDVLADPGAADVTAHVDFAAIAAAAMQAGARVSGPLTQGAFLTALGIEARAAQLRDGATPRQAGEILEGLKRLIAPAEMGNLFKVMALSNSRQPAPEGFAT